jgi:hypothetical protein
MGNRRVAATRQRVIMARNGAGWAVSELVEDEPELTELSSLTLDDSP